MAAESSKKLTHSFPWLERGIIEIFPNQPESNDPNENLMARLRQSDQPLRIKFGIDPTGSEIHLGHSIVYRKLRAFQDAGHTAVLLIGDFTARIGDPTGKSEMRKQLSEAEVRQNAETYIEQLRPILDFDTPGRLEIRYNSEWLSQLDLAKILELLSTMTVGQMLAKEGFAERYRKETPIYLHEFLYPLMQGYDSVALEADVELGGTDQKFNLAVGRDLQRHFGQRPQFGLLMPLLIGTDGVQKMSKSLGNYVSLTESAESMYAKLQKVPDHLIEDYFTLLTAQSLSDLPPAARERQILLALDVVGQYHGEAAAQKAKAAAEAVAGGKAEQANVEAEFSLQAVTFPAKLFYILSASGLCDGSSDARRQIQGGAVRLDGEPITDLNQTFESAKALAGKVLQVGKRKFVRLVA
jgi:tyrosyl-tRNA synthetase